jgi:sulfatase maturation enzyme AslB (radical SAM superfamily)
MGIDIKTLACNAACASCYENSIRQCGGGPAVDFDLMLAALKANLDTCPSSNPSLHGGEPLLMGKTKAEALLRMIYDAKQQTSIQTNGC